MSMTLTEAAKAIGRDKSTVRRAVKSGLISGTRDAFGVWKVEPAELFRIYPPAEMTRDDEAGANSRAVPDSAAADALVAELRAVISDLRRDRDEWRDQAQRLALPKPAEATPRQSLWRWLRTTA